MDMGDYQDYLGHSGEETKTIARERIAEHRQRPVDVTAALEAIEQAEREAARRAELLERARKIEPVVAYGIETGIDYVYEAGGKKRETVNSRMRRLLKD